MYMPLLATESGIIRLSKPAGSVLQAGDIVGVLTLDDPSRVKKIDMFEATFPDFGPPEIIGDKCHRKYRHVMNRINSILGGFDHRGHVSLLVRNMFDLLRNNELPLLVFQEALSSISGRIPATLEQQLLSALSEASASGEGGGGNKQFPANVLKFLMEETIESISAVEDRNSFAVTVLPLQSVLDEYSQGLKYHEINILYEILHQFYTIEELFNKKSFEDVLNGLREKNKGADDGWKTVVAIARAYVSPDHRADLVLSILDQIRISSLDGTDEAPTFQRLRPIVEKLACLSSNHMAKVSLKAREFLLSFQMPSYQDRRNETLNMLSGAVRYKNNSNHSSTTSDQAAPMAGEPVFHYENIVSLIAANYSILDVLPSFFYHNDLGIRSLALYSYVLRVSQAYSISAVRHRFNMNPVILEWEYVLRSSFTAVAALGKSGGQSCSENSSSSDNGSPLRRQQNGFGSFSDFKSLDYDAKTPRRALLCAFDKVEEMESKLESVIQLGGKRSEQQLQQHQQQSSIMYVLNIGISMESNGTLFSNDASSHAYFQGVIAKHLNLLRSNRYRRVTFMVLANNQFPRYFTYRDNLDFKEDSVIRNIEPAMGKKWGKI